MGSCVSLEIVGHLRRKRLRLHRSSELQLQRLLDHGVVEPVQPLSLARTVEVVTAVKPLGALHLQLQQLQRCYSAATAALQQLQQLQQLQHNYSSVGETPTYTLREVVCTSTDHTHNIIIPMTPPSLTGD